MFGPHPQDTAADLRHKIGMVNAFGRVGLGTEAERDDVVAQLRQAMDAIGAESEALR
jgi:hypothetical protein